MLYEHKFQVPFSYTIAIASLTIAGATAHLISLILDLEASASGFVREIFALVPICFDDEPLLGRLSGFQDFRKAVANIEPALTIILVPLWIGVVIAIGAKQKMDLIGFCISKSPEGYGTKLYTDVLERLILTLCSGYSPFRLPFQK